MAQIHERTTTALARAGVIRIAFGEAQAQAPATTVEVTTEAAERLAQDIQRALSGLGQNPAAP